jgi:phosphatidylserine/phosphatidylglycerophosphate/cardiolipin synthase-like enzyme
MATFLDTTGISYHLEQIIKTANERLIIISPFLKMNDRIKELLDDRDRFKIDVRVIYGKNELSPDEINWLKLRNSIRTSFCKNLHAKCYLNEKAALITSMNLYDFSQVNNNEMGIHIVKSEDSKLYEDLYMEVGRLLRYGEEIKVSVERVSPKDAPEKSNSPKTGNTITKRNHKGEGVCIRCKAPLNLDPTHPLCKGCYGVWKQFANEDHEEKFCHICGKPNKSTINKPACYECFRNHKELFAG